MAAFKSGSLEELDDYYAKMVEAYKSYQSNPQTYDVYMHNLNNYYTNAKAQYERTGSTSFKNFTPARGTDAVNSRVSNEKVIATPNGVTRTGGVKYIQSNVPVERPVMPAQKGTTKTVTPRAQAAMHPEAVAKRKAIMQSYQPQLDQIKQNKQNLRAQYQNGSLSRDAYKQQRDALYTKRDSIYDQRHQEIYGKPRVNETAQTAREYAAKMREQVKGMAAKNIAAAKQARGMRDGGRVSKSYGRMIHYNTTQCKK